VGERAEHDEGRGVTVVERQRARVLRFSTRGHLTRELAAFSIAHMAFVIDELRASVAHDEDVKLNCLYDWSAMTGYDGGARSDSTQFAIRHRAKFASLAILMTSPIVAMGVTVANMLVGGFMQATTDPARFQDIVTRVLSESAS
jgi:hypothetical protein